MKEVCCRYGSACVEGMSAGEAQVLRRLVAAVRCFGWTLYLSLTIWRPSASVVSAAIDIA